MTAIAEAYRRLSDGARLSFGAEEFVFVELSESMSLPVALRVQAIVAALAARELAGVVDCCPANASYLVRYDPDVLAPESLVGVLGELHREHPETAGVVLDTEIVEIPVLYDDPWTREVLLRFRSRHQSPGETDLEYSARVNGFDDVAGLVAAHSARPFIVTFPCFVPGNAECLQLVPAERQIQTPKYLTPRTQTPARALGHGGAFSTIYPAAGAGGYQLLGRSAVPVVDMHQRLPDFAGSIVLAQPSTIFKFTSIELDEYFAIRAAVRDASYRYRRTPVRFELDRFLAEPDAYAGRLVELLS